MWPNVLLHLIPMMISEWGSEWNPLHHQCRHCSVRAIYVWCYTFKHPTQQGILTAIEKTGTCFSHSFVEKEMYLYLNGTGIDNRASCVQSSELLLFDLVEVCGVRRKELKVLPNNWLWKSINRTNIGTAYPHPPQRSPRVDFQSGNSIDEEAKQPIAHSQRNSL